jgi:hypothetical protein
LALRSTHGVERAWIQAHPEQDPEEDPP